MPPRARRLLPILVPFLLLFFPPTSAAAACPPSVSANLSNGVLTITASVSVGCGHGGITSLKIDGTHVGHFTCYDASQPCVYNWTNSGYCYRTGTHTVEATAACNHRVTKPDGTQSCEPDPPGTATTTFTADTTPRVSASYAGPSAEGGGTRLLPPRPPAPPARPRLLRGTECGGGPPPPPPPPPPEPPKGRGALDRRLRPPCP